jgi:hypothetical protein
MAMHGVLAVSSGMHASRIEETQPPRLCAGELSWTLRGAMRIPTQCVESIQHSIPRYYKRSTIGSHRC